MKNCANKTIENLSKLELDDEIDVKVFHEFNSIRPLAETM